MKLVGVALLLCVGLSACQQAKSERGAHWTKEASELAVYATQVPIYPGATIEDAMGADLYGETKADHTERMTFFLETDGSHDELVAWYEEQLPDASRKETEEGATVFSFAPEGAEDGEDAGVWIDEDGSLRIFENTKAGKH
ncbi:MAG: hypothetical protein U0527_03080 [Candidatus Eisenbacteria bacterium]